MNSIKNAIVTVTLLAVGYGSYVVLNEPMPTNTSIQTEDRDGNSVQVPSLAPADAITTPAVTVSSEPVPVVSTSTAPSNPFDQAIDSTAEFAASPNVQSGDAFPDLDTILQIPEPKAPQNAPGVANESKPRPVLDINLPGNKVSVKPEIAELPPLPDLMAPSPNNDLGAPPSASVPLVPKPMLPQETQIAPVATESDSISSVELPPVPDLPATTENRFGPAGVASPNIAPFDAPVASQPKSLTPSALAVPDQPQDAAVPMPTALAPAQLNGADAMRLNAPVGNPSDDSRVAALVPEVIPGNAPSGPSNDVFGDDEVVPGIQGPVVSSPVSNSPVLDSPVLEAPQPNGNAAFEKVWAEVTQLLKDDDPAKALRTLTPWCSDSNLTAEQNSRCMRKLDELAGQVVYSRESFFEPAYTVRAGETLDEIAASYKVPMELLAQINGITPPFALSTGESLKVVRGPFRADVSLSSKVMTLYVGAHYAGRFSVDVGRDLPPEEAFYEVAEKNDGSKLF